MKQVSAAVRAEILAPSTRMCDLAQIDHPSGMIYLCSGIMPVTWGALTFKSAGTMGSVSGIGQTVEARSQEVRLSLASPSFDTDALAIIGQPVQGRQAFIWRAFLTPDWQVIPDPIQLANITLDSVEFAEGDGKQVLNLVGYMTQYAARRSMTVYHSNETQQARFPGDTGFDRMVALADKIV
jgi:hypothetical protein